MTYGERLRELRAERHLSLRQVEERGGPNKDTLSLIERDVHKPHAQTLGRIAKAFGVSVTELRAELEAAERPLASAPPSQEKLFNNGALLEEERRDLFAAEPTDRQKAAPVNYATDWIELVVRSTEVNNAALSHLDISLDEVLQISEQGFYLWSLCHSHEPLILRWCDEEKETAWEAASYGLEALFNRIDRLVKQKRKEEQDLLDQAKLARLQDYHERQRARAAG